ncbi:MAG TPA: alpha/beta hydrolase, partial [Actinomycetes bacterium]|nr:alpha/beta hydrolase [Actinomycetes bacterium]
MKAGAILLVVVAVLAASVGLLWAFQRHLIYLPSPGPVPPAASVLPGAEDVSFQTADGLRLRGWFVPPVGGARPPGPAVLVCNGNGGDRSMRAALAVALSRLGLAVLLFDYRGYGGNPGSPTEAGLAADARAALGYLAGRPEVDPERVVYFGESLGAAVALRLATERPPAALVLRSPFASLAEVGRRHYPMLPVSLLLRDRYDAAALAGRLTAPLLVVAG